MSKTKSIVVTIILSILIALVGVMCFVSFPFGKTKQFNSILSNIGKGIDISGGYYVVLTPEGSSGESTAEDLEAAMVILRQRLDDKGYTEAVITVQDGNKVRVEIPQIDDDGTVLEVIGQTGNLTFQDYTHKEWLNGEEHIKSAYVSTDRENGGYLIVLNFTDKGVSKFAQATTAVKDMSDTKLYIYLGDSLISSPTVSDTINNTQATITGYTDYEEALSIASVIDSGRLPINYTVSESRAISSKLGENAINSSVIAGAIGLLIVFVLLLVLYKGMGLAADVSLLIYVLLYIIFLAIVPGVQLTLPGIAGILLSIGMAVDANIVIFERVKEEFKMGKTVRAAVKQGYRRAFVTVFDSNITTIFAAIVLWILCPGTIKGFAITLLIGIVLSLFCGILVTRWLIGLFLPMASDEQKFLKLKREGGSLND